MSLNIEILSKAANQARGLCMDAVQASQSGHLGLPLGCAEIGAVLFGYELRYNPDQPRWINRDIFVLSGGHGSMFLYAWLHMSGYDLPMSEIKRFRQLHSKTPGHPEWNARPGHSGKAWATQSAFRWRQKWLPRASTLMSTKFSISM
jgi:transketolase